MKLCRCFSGLGGSQRPLDVRGGSGAWAVIPPLPARPGRVASLRSEEASAARPGRMASLRSEEASALLLLHRRIVID